MFSSFGSKLMIDVLFVWFKVDGFSKLILLTFPLVPLHLS